MQAQEKNHANLVFVSLLPRESFEWARKIIHQVFAGFHILSKRHPRHDQEDAYYEMQDLIEQACHEYSSIFQFQEKNKIYFLVVTSTQIMIQYRNQIRLSSSSGTVKWLPLMKSKLDQLCL